MKKSIEEFKGVVPAVLSVFDAQEELDENLSDDSEVDENLLQNESLEELAAALRRMPEELRDLIVLRYYDNRPLTEVAEMMGLSYGAVKLRHQKALGLLRKALTA